MRLRDSILYKKLLKRYGMNKNILKEINFDVNNYSNKQYLPSIATISRKVDIEKELNYTIEDFYLDYSPKFKEKELYYEISKKGFDLKTYSDKVGLPYGTLLKILKSDRYDLTPQNNFYLQELLKLDENKKMPVVPNCDTILYEKLLKRFTTYTEITHVIGEFFTDTVKWKNKLPSFHEIAKKIDLEKEMNYTYEDFLIDYSDVVKKYKMPRLYYDFAKTGKSLKEFSKTKKITLGILYKILKYGLDDRKDGIKNKFYEYLIDDFKMEELKQFETIMNEKFCKLYGERMKLEAFRKKYNIKQPVLPIGDRYSLAFDGSVFIYMKNKNIEKV